MRLGINARFLAAPVGGVQRFAREVSARLAQLGETTLFVPRGAVVTDAWSGARVIRGRLAGNAWEQLELPAAARGSCDVLFHPANTAPVRGTTPHVVMLHDVFPLVQPRWYGSMFARWYTFLIPRVTASAARVLTTSQHSARVITHALGVDPARIVVVPQGLAPFDGPPAGDVADAALARLAVRRPFVLALGAGDARKNVDFAVRVIERHAQRWSDSPALVIVGHGARRIYGNAHRIRVQGGRARVMPDLRMPGRVSDVELHALYGAASAVLCPSRDEGFGRVPLEALCCGTPCLVTDAPYAAELLEGTPARRLPLDAERWAAQLQTILQHAERVPTQVGEQLQRRWSWDEAAQAVWRTCALASGADRRAEAFV